MKKPGPRSGERRRGRGHGSGPEEGHKGEVTRERILEAARRVFAEHPYRSASIRTIGKIGGFDHPLIHYYFPTKAALFEAVVAEICEEFFRANLSWFEGIEQMRPSEGLAVYVDRFLEYNFQRPAALRIIALNYSQVGRLEEMPGYHQIPDLLARTRHTFEQKVPLNASSEEIGMFITSFNSLAISYLGAAPCQAQVLGMDAGSEEYRTWVKNTFVFIFQALLEKLIRGEKN